MSTIIWGNAGVPTALRNIRLATIALVFALGSASTSSAQLYRSSVVGTDYDFIRDEDPSAFLCLEFKGERTREMPDKRGETELFQSAFTFVAYFDDGTRVDIAIDDAFKTETAAHAEATRYVDRLGKLPTSLRQGVRRLVVHHGGRDTTAFSDVGLIVVYSENAAKRISTHDLEETIFHESVHASWDKRHADSLEWREAQQSDGGFVTRYAQKNPRGEDLAESALFAFALLHHPGRIPAADAASIRQAISARIAFVETLLPRGEPLVYSVGPKYACDGSGTTFTVGGGSRSKPEGDTCRINTASALGVSDILSNALMCGLRKEESQVSSYLSRAKYEYAVGDELVSAAATEFGIDRATLEAKVLEYLHCNCRHAGGGAADRSDDAEDSANNECRVNVETALGVSDILSNALKRGLGHEEAIVNPFLREHKVKYTMGDELLDAAARRFDVDRATLDAKVAEYLHCNCTHGDLEAGVAATSPMDEALPGRDDTRTSGGDAGTTLAPETPPVLYFIASLLGLLLLVNVATLAVLVKRVS